MTCTHTSPASPLLRGWPLRAALLLLMFCPWSPASRAQPAGLGSEDALASVTLALERAEMSLGDLFAAVEQQTEYRFVYAKAEVPLAARIRIEPGKSVPLDRLLRAARDQAGVRFQRTGFQIAVRGRDGSQAAAGTIVGRVRDARANSYLAHAAVSIPALDRAAITTTDGEYTLANVPAGAWDVVVSYIGYDDDRETVAVPEAGEARADFDLTRSAVQLSKFTVYGEREGQARALQEKRTANELMDVVSADSAGKLPDGNAAEAVRRLPGVFAEIDQNEGRFIVVRGIDANLNNITINGLSVGSPGGGDRGAQMDAVPADLISRIEVVKAVTPDRDAQAVGASINIVTPSAFDRPEPFAYGTVAGGYFHGPNNDIPRNASITAGTQFGGGKWGLLVGGSYNYRHYISNRRSGGGTWWPSAEDGPGADIYFPDTQSLYYYDVQRWRQGANLNLEFRPSDDHQFFARVVVNRFKDDEGRDLNSFEFYRTSYPDSYTATTAHFSKGRSTVEYRHYVQKHRIDNYSVGGKDTLGDGSLKLDYTFSYGETGIKVPERLDWQFRSAANLTSDIDTSGPLWKVTPEAKWYDLSTYPLRRLLIRSDNEFEDIYNAIANLKRDQTFFGHQGFWQIGGKYLWHKKGWDRLNTNYYPAAPAFTLADYDLTDEPRTIFDGFFPMTRRIDFAKAQQLFQDHPELFTLNPADSLSDSYSNYFRITEDTAAGYAMAQVNFGQLSVLGGVRLEDTSVDVTGIEFPEANGTVLPPQPYYGHGHYVNLLPGLHLKYNLTRNWLLRAAWTNTIGRPSYSDIGVTRSFSYALDEEGGSTYSGSITDGNPDLKPYESMNFDFGSEYYFQNTGILSVGAFSKVIKNPIYDYTYTSRNVTFEGLDFSSLSYEKPLNADRGRVSGLELNYQQQLTMLPAPFDGLGFGVNFTYVDSSETLPTRPNDKLPFAKQAEKVYNAALFYEKGPIQARIAYTYTGAYVLSFGDDFNGDDYQGERKTIDAKISYRINPHFTVFADVINLGQEPLDEYARYPERNSATEHYWWTANFGINWRL
ncbi:MAG TPA: TonB-dependent receptor [Opitutus sp.]|nr:TonB-dependent receptor [Opitutus sp.]